MLKPYERLSEVYDKEEWGKFSLKYTEILNNLNVKYNLRLQNILDISCGTGDLLNELSEKYNVIGSDISKEMIHIAKRKYPDIEFYVSDMAELILDIGVDLILSPFDSINYLIGKDHILRAFKNINNLLNENGHFLFDFNTDKLYEDKHNGTIESKMAGTKFKQICKYDKNERIAKTIFDFGKGTREVHIRKAYNYDEIRELLCENNFSIIFSFDIFKNEIVNADSYKILVLAKKKITDIT